MSKKTGTFVVSSILSVALLLSTGAGALYANASQARIEHEVIIVYNNQQGKDSILEDSVDVQHVFETINAVSATLTNTNLNELIVDPNIAYIERNIPFKITGEDIQTASVQSIPREQSQWNFQAVKPTNMWTKGYTGTGVKVAVIDSGISAHSELSIAGGISTVNYTTSTTDDNGHGTHVAGIIAAKNNNAGIVGIAPDVQLYAVKSMDQAGDGTLQDVMEGIDWAIQNDMDIINLSLGTEYYSKSFNILIDQAYAAGILIVGAAGNSGAGTNTISYPAKYESVIAVSAIDEQRARGDFSSTGTENEVAAPGVDIVSTSSTGAYAQSSGTSQAAPHVTGMLALMKQAHPWMSNIQLRNQLRYYAIDLGAPGRDDEFGYGFVTFAQQLDVTAPAEVSHLIVSEVTTITAKITWENPTDTDFSKVNLYSNGAFTGTVTGATYEYTGLTPNTDYTFQVRTVDTTGNESAGLNIMTTTAATEPDPVKDLTAPAEVSNLEAFETTDASITLRWSNPVDEDFAKTKIYVNEVVVGETTESNYTLTGLPSNQFYTIVVKTEDTSGNISLGTSILAATRAAASPVSNSDPVTPAFIPDVQILPVNITPPPTGGSAIIVATDINGVEEQEAQAALEQARKSLSMIGFIEAKLSINALTDADKRENFQKELDKLKLELGIKELLAKNEVRASVPINVSVQVAMKSGNYKYIDLPSVKPGENVFVVNSKGEVVKDIQVYVLWNRIFIKPTTGVFTSKETYTLIIDKTVKAKPSVNSEQSYSLKHPLTLDFTIR